MGTLRRGDGEVVFEQEGVGQVRRVESGDVTVEFGRVERAIDPTPLFRGLPDGMCQCRHQGYVVEGRLTFKTKDGPFDVAAGEAFDVSPGHIPLPQAGCEWVQITATAEQRKTDEVIRRNAAVGAGTGDDPAE
ncbi:MAG: cupin domain-containing protein [Actinomycetota bacterium]|nr:cupin domain-containing protein [Actinomycetota bacterium]